MAMRQSAAPVARCKSPCHVLISRGATWYLLRHGKQANSEAGCADERPI